MEYVIGVIVIALFVAAVAAMQKRRLKTPENVASRPRPDLPKDHDEVLDDRTEPLPKELQDRKLP